MADRSNDRRRCRRPSSAGRAGGEATIDLGQALASVIDLEPAELEAVLAAAEGQRPGVREALRAASEAEAHRFADLSRRAFAAADRLADHVTPTAGH